VDQRGPDRAGAKRAGQAKAVATVVRIKIRKAINGHEAEFLSGLIECAERQRAQVAEWFSGEQRRSVYHNWFCLSNSS